MNLSCIKMDDKPQIHRVPRATSDSNRNESHGTDIGECAELGKHHDVKDSSYFFSLANPWCIIDDFARAPTPWQEGVLPIMRQSRSLRRH